MDQRYFSVTQAAIPHPTGAQIALQNALLELLQEYELPKIRVNRLCRMAFVERSTFYTYYHNIDDLLSEMEDDLLCNMVQWCREAMRQDSAQEGEVSLLLSRILKFIKQNQKSFHTFLITRPSYRFMAKWKKDIKCHLWEYLSQTKAHIPEDIVLEMTASAIIAGYIYYLKYPENECISDICLTVLSVLRDDGQIGADLCRNG